MTTSHPYVVTGPGPGGGTLYSVNDPLLLIHGYPWTGTTVSCSQTWANTISYLKSSGNTGRYHPGLGSDTLAYTGTVYTIGYYQGDPNCTDNINTATGEQYANNCNGYWAINSDTSHVGTNAEALEHVSCELAWWIYDRWGEYQNINIVAHSMGGLIVRSMLEQVSQHNAYFPPGLTVHDAVTFSTPQGGIETSQYAVLGFPTSCNYCYQSQEMTQGSSYMNDLLANADGIGGLGGTDWTMEGSLAPTLLGASVCEPLDWFWQATYMSNGHRLGYNTGIPGYYGYSGNWLPGYTNGYCHGDYMNDQSDYFDAPYYYQDFQSRSSQSYSYTTGAPHSLHDMLFAFVYYGW